jgi:hypothetical protein
MAYHRKDGDVLLCDTMWVFCSVFALFALDS